MEDRPARRGPLHARRLGRSPLSCPDAETGETQYTTRLPGIRNVYASPVGADERIYVTGRNGTTAVLRHGREPKLLARNRVGDGISASPVAVGSELFLRGKRRLYCLVDGA